MRERVTANHGMTLIEVLLTLTIMAIASSVIYGTFITGLKLYQKIGIEGQLRDDADYAATMILNEMYNHPPSYVASYEDSGAKGLKLVRYRDKTVNSYIVEKNTGVEQELFIYFKDEKLYLETHKFDSSTNKETIEKTEISSESSKYTTVNDGTKSEVSSISLGSCSQYDTGKNCQHGTISLNIVIEDSHQRINSLLKTEPLILKSTFGF